MTGKQVAELFIAQNPQHRFAVNSDDSAVAVWNEQGQRWQRVAARAITGQWVQLDHDFLVNGQPVPAEWGEIVANCPTSVCL